MKRKYLKKHHKKYIDKLWIFLKRNSIALIIIIFFGCLHIPRITTPPIDEHSWRQVDTASVARNFQFESNNIFKPRVDIRGEYSGITGMEFPLYNFTLFLFNLIFGYTHWHGRIITLAFSCLSLWYFYSFIKTRYSKNLANFSLAALATIPLFFVFSKNIQPDIMMVFFMILSLYFAQRYSEKLEDKYYYLLLCALALTMLIKIPAAFIIFPILVVLGRKGIGSIFNVRKLSLAFAIVALPVLGWYVYSDYLSKHYGLGNYFYGDISIVKSFKLAISTGFWRTIAEYCLPTRFPVSSVYLLVLIGALVAFAKKNYFALVWLLSFIVFLGIFAIKSFYHNYYALPLLPPLALLIGISLDWLHGNLRKESKSIAVVFLLGLVAFAALLQIKRTQSLYKAQASTAYPNLEAIASNYVGKKDLIITNGSVNPIMLYFSNRKGWSLPDSMMAENILASYIKSGAKFILINKALISTESLESVNLNHRKLYEDDDFIIFNI